VVVIQPIFFLHHAHPFLLLAWDRGVHTRQINLHNIQVSHCAPLQYVCFLYICTKKSHFGGHLWSLGNGGAHYERVVVQGLRLQGRLTLCGHLSCVGHGGAHHEGDIF